MDREKNAARPAGCMKVRTGIDVTALNSEYQFETVYQGQQAINCHLFRDRNLTANDILTPSQTAEEAAQSPIRRAQRRERSAERRLSAAEAELAKLRQERKDNNR